jgi:hypothetical protein
LIEPPLLAGLTADNSFFNASAIKSNDLTELVLAGINASTKSGSPFVFNTA